MPLATDPKLRSRLEKHTAKSNGRMSRKDILKVVESEMSGEPRALWVLRTVAGRRCSRAPGHLGSGSMCAHAPLQSRVACPT